ncbi:MAG: hypothetical protein WEA77_03095 [Hyphomonas sp.]|uniref:hypothetical protein n=1 Tax=Hyphomonas sp. TaxID=87 RepID=UPI00349FFAF0
MTQTKGFRTANRRYQYLFWPLMALYVVIVFLVSHFTDAGTSPLGLKILAATAASPAILGALSAILRLVRETDEYCPLRHLTAPTQAGAITAGIAFVAGLLQISGALPQFSAFWFGSLFFVAYGLFSCILHFGFGRTV